MKAVVVTGPDLAPVYADFPDPTPGDGFVVDGAQAPGCSLLAGPTRDLNLMCRDGACSMRRVEPEVAWAQGFAARGLFCAVAGRWTDGQQCCELQADTLLWSTDANAAGWSFVPAAASPDGGTAAWWLGFTPAGASA